MLSYLARLTYSNLVGELVDCSRISALARPASPAVDDGLRRESDVGEAASVGDDEAVGQGRGSALGPAGAAVVRHVLVHRPRQVVGAVDVTPVPRLLIPKAQFCKVI